MKTPDDPTSRYPKRLSDASYDFKLISVYLISTIVLAAAGREIPVGT